MTERQRQAILYQHPSHRCQGCGDMVDILYVVARPGMQHLFALRCRSCRDRRHALVQRTFPSIRNRQTWDRLVLTS